MSAAASPMLSRRAAGALLGAALVFGACTRADAPVDPVWGKEPCAHCKMLVGDKRYAAQVVDDGGDRRYFDDVGCLFLWMEAHRAARSWVHDAASSAWLDARSASYVQGARTPMDFGFEASPSGGVSFDAARAAVLAKGRARP